ncbi:DNA-3-methyladenine glycosylase family protein [Rhizobium straminoryzae]|uniref:DNA-3-methyladenine glycosylase II n=1 Tax=Rhizobium straminoryzae TaxID=1387186 RepID=A0A549SZV6_9HYPH|nr:DNA-3-methyladenine glycosylase [Rhizobium straminoryzae]TRL35159.1 DNA-3-methyladenine glycosylase 2 family protein [Rhizobium straminoryzae]
MVQIRGMAEIEEGLAALARLDDRLSTVIAAAGPIPLRLSPPGFAGLCEIIVSQMVSKAAASAIWSRIQAAGAMTPAVYLGHSPEVVAGFGLSRAKARAIEGLAAALVESRFDLDVLSSLVPEEARARLVALPGVGPWTAEVYLMFCLGAADVFPAGDVALRAAVGHALSMEVRPSVPEVSELSLSWQPWRSVAARLFWAYYARVLRRDAIPMT